MDGLVKVWYLDNACIVTLEIKTRKSGA